MQKVQVAEEEEEEDTEQRGGQETFLWVEKWSSKVMGAGEEEKRCLFL